MASTCYVFIAEISLPSERGMLASLGPVFVSFGVLLVYLLGYLMDWHLASIVCAVTAVISFALIYFLPETPPWLVSKGKVERARATLIKLRGSKEIAEKELTQILQSIDTKGSHSCKEYLSKCNQSTVWKPFLILIFFFLFQEGSGMYIIVYYATNIFQSLGPVLDSSVESIIVGIVRLVTSAFASVLIQNFGRKQMAILSSSLMAISMSSGAVYNYIYGEMSMSDRPFSYIPFACLVVNVIASMLGMLQLPWVMIGELFPLSVRGFMSGVVSSLAYLFIFAIIKIYPNLMSTLNLTGMMALFSVISILTIFFVVFFLPETQGKLLIDIENSFREKAASKEEVCDKKNELPTVDPVYILKL